MGNVYVWLDKGLEHEQGEILGVHIDMDLQQKSRRELCRHIENKFGWEEDSFWNLESTQKIRLCCQKARQMQYINARPSMAITYPPTGIREHIGLGEEE